MPSLADSTAFRDDDRLLVQHQVALSILQGLVAGPVVKSLRWLDLGCGRGQIIAALDKNLTAEARAKVSYLAYDVSQEFLRETLRTATSLGLASVEAKVGDLDDFNRLVAAEETFDFITLTNTVHEVRPGAIAALLVDSLIRLTDHGCFFVYDMESLNPPELGAVPWERDEFERILTTLTKTLGATQYRPQIGQWKHKTCNGWSAQISRSHLLISPREISARRELAIASVSATIRDLLERKLERCRESLETLTRFGLETPSEESSKIHLLHTNWSVGRALEQVKKP